MPFGGLWRRSFSYNTYNRSSSLSQGSPTFANLNDSSSTTSSEGTSFTTVRRGIGSQKGFQKWKKQDKRVSFFPKRTASSSPPWSGCNDPLGEGNDILRADIIPENPCRSILTSHSDKRKREGSLPRSFKLDRKGFRGFLHTTTACIST